MLKEKSFFERLAGSISVDDEEPIDDFMPMEGRRRRKCLSKHVGKKDMHPFHVRAPMLYMTMKKWTWKKELSVDVYQTATEIIIETMVAGVKPEDLHLSITRDMVTIKGRRDGNTQVTRRLLLKNSTGDHSHEQSHSHTKWKSKKQKLLKSMDSSSSGYQR